MSKPELVEHIKNCDVYAKKIKLEISTSAASRTDTVKCLDVLRSLKSGDAREDSTEKLSSISPPFPPRRRHRSVLQNKTNGQDTKSECRSSKKSFEKGIVRDASHPGTLAEMMNKVPSVEKYYDVKKRIGYGSFSCVFVGNKKLSDAEGEKKMYALKHIYSSSTSTKRILFETKCLREIGGCNNVAGLERIIGNSQEHVLVMPYYRHDKFTTLIRELSFAGVREYLRNLLIALRRVHKFNVLHRDIKPSNFLYDSKTKSCALVDFGLAHNAHYYKPTKSDSLRSSLWTSSAQPKVASNVKPVKHKGLSARSLHTRSSSMVAMAKNLHKSQSSRKRSADDNEEIDLLNLPAASSTKKPCIARSYEHAERQRSGSFVGTPRPAFRQRPGFVPRGIPVFLPNAPSPSPLSTSSERTLTSPLGGGSTGGHTAGKTIGDMLPCIKSASRSKPAISKVHQKQALDENYSVCGCTLKQKCKPCAASCLVAPRAGTSGFRAPEVLIQCPHQTTAVDVWSVGIMFLSLLSGRYPFFKPTDDMESLVQMIAVFGTEKLKNLARCCGKKLTAPYYCSGHDLRSVVEFFRKMGEEQNCSGEFIKPAIQKPIPPSASSNPGRTTKNTSQLYVPPYKPDEISSSAYDLLQRLLDVNPLTRITAKEALDHSFFTSEAERDAKC